VVYSRLIPVAVRIARCDHTRNSNVGRCPHRIPLHSRSHREEWERPGTGERQGRHFLLIPKPDLLARDHGAEVLFDLRLLPYRDAGELSYGYGIPYPCKEWFENHRHEGLY
jgi:hypothetical protein